MSHITTIRQNEVRQSVAIDIGDRQIPCRPFRKSKLRPKGKIALPVIKINQLSIRVVIANSNIKKTISIKIGQTPSVGAVRHLPKIIGPSYPAPPISKKNPVNHRPMPSFHKQNVKMSIPIQIPKTHVRRRISSRLQQHTTVKVRKMLLRKNMLSHSTNKTHNKKENFHNYSVLRLLIGFAMAAFTAWKLTVIRVTSIATPATAIKIPTPISVFKV